MTGSGKWLQAVAVGIIIVQILDAGVGVTIRDKVKPSVQPGRQSLIWQPSSGSSANDLDRANDLNQTGRYPRDITSNQNAASGWRKCTRSTGA